MTTTFAAPTSTILTAADPGWDEARQAWNLAVDQRPAAIARPASAQDVAAAVIFARRHGLRVAAQGTGHNAAPLGPLDDTVLIKTEGMRRVTINPRRMTARAEAGAVWQDVTDAAARHGLAALAGSSPNVGVTGFSTGGGMSWLSRAYGLSASNTEAFEVVTADGRLRQADAGHETGLFWALRGGGGSFVVIDAFYLGTEAEAGEILAPLRALRPVTDTVRPMPARELGQVHLDPSQPTPAAGDGMLLDTLPAAAIDGLVRLAGPGVDTPLLAVELRQLGGEMRRARPGSGALATMNAGYALSCGGVVTGPESAAAITRDVRAIQAAMAPWAARQMYLNFAETRRDPASFWTRRPTPGCARSRPRSTRRTGSGPTSPSRPRPRPRRRPARALSRKDLS